MNSSGRVLAALMAAALLAACSPFGGDWDATAGELDSQGRDVDVLPQMRAWVEKNVPADWKVTTGVRYLDVIDDMGVDTGKDFTTYHVEAEGVPEEEFTAWANSLERDGPEATCENATAQDDEDAGADLLRQCFAPGLWESQTAGNEHFSMDASWESYADESQPSHVDIDLEDSPHQ